MAIKRGISKDMKIWALVGATLLTFLLGWILEQIGFKSQPAPGQAFVTVFTKEKAANVYLKATIHPTSPWKDWLTVRVNGPQAMKQNWLLVIQCPAVRAARTHTVGLYVEPGPQPPIVTSVVTVAQHVGTSWEGYLRCFPAQGSSNPTLTFADATLPALETDPAIAAAQEAPQLYAERDNSSHRIKELVEIFPPCPSATPTATMTSPAPTGTVSQRAPVSLPGRSAPTASAPSVNTTPSPNPPTSSCYLPQPLSTTPDVYRLPVSVATAEILKNANLSDYRVDSIFPPGQFGKGDQITWRGVSGLSPSLFVTNLTAEHRLNEYTFFSGVLFGICGGAIVTLLVEVIDIWRERHKKAGTAVAE
jgi:hypothetical protein